MVDVLKLKVFVNKRNSQGSVVLPKKVFKGGFPEFVSVIKKDVFYKKKVK